MSSSSPRLLSCGNCLSKYSQSFLVRCRSESSILWIKNVIERAHLGLGSRRGCVTVAQHVWHRYQRDQVGGERDWSMCVVGINLWSELLHVLQSKRALMALVAQKHSSWHISYVWQKTSVKTNEHTWKREQSRNRTVERERERERKNQH